MVVFDPDSLDACVPEDLLDLPDKVVPRDLEGTLLDQGQAPTYSPFLDA